MAINGMIKFKSNNEEKGLFTKHSADTFGELCEELTLLPTNALKKIMGYLQDNNGGYLDMFDPKSWCEYGYIIDLDKLKYDTYSVYATQTNPASTTRRLNYVGTNHFDRVKEVEGEKHSLIITWDGLYKGLYDLPLTDEQTQKLADILISTGEWFARNVFNSIAQDYKPLPETIPDDWIILDTNKYVEELNKKGTRTSTGNDDSLKLSNGKYAEDEETKEAFEGYMSKVDKYNEQVANGEKPDVKMGDLLNEYSDTFYDESLEEKIKKSENEFNKREKDTKIDNLISSIDKKISELDNNISFEKAKKIADEKAKEWNKVVVSISENNEYWLFNADNDSHPIDDGAGSCYISKKDGSIRPLNRWDIEFTKKFDETAKDLLVRTSLSELYGYHSKNNINDEKSALEYIDNISKAFLKYTFKPDNNFIFLGRKKIIYDEINDILKGNKEVDNPIYFVLGSLEEFICNNNFVYMSDGDQWEKGWEDLRNRNDIYSAMNVICLEEKNIIDNIISEIKNYIKTRTTL